MVSSDFGKLEVRRHLISGADWAIAGAATNVVAPATAPPLRNERRFMMYPLSWIPGPLTLRKEPCRTIRPSHNELRRMCEGDLYLTMPMVLTSGWSVGFVMVSSRRIGLLHMQAEAELPGPARPSLQAWRQQ